MADSQYDKELKLLPETYRVAMKMDIEPLKKAIAGAADSSIIGVGSGGSFTIATLLCTFHEAYTGRVSRPATPLEIICNPMMAASSPIFLISAEGKNPDIIEAVQRARRHSARSVHILTNKTNSPLVELAESLTEIGSHIFPLEKKDGYLATNSLLLNAVLVARIYEELDRERNPLPVSLDLLRLNGQSIDEWLEKAGPFVEIAAKRAGLLLVFSPLLRPIATDLESKLSESALLYCQLADLRSFAHGRHLWLAERSNDCAILALIEPSLQHLWDEMQALLPVDVPILTMPFEGGSPRDLQAGLVTQMRLVSAFARQLNKDPGRPDVPKFGRGIHYIDLPKLIPPPPEAKDMGIQSKCEALGVRWPLMQHNAAMIRSLGSFSNSLEKQVFRALILDYDGTLSSSKRNDTQPTDQIIQQLKRLIEGGVLVGIATGRGGSIQEHLRRCLPETMWPKIFTGLYSSGWINDLTAEIPIERESSEYLSHVTRVVRRLQSIGAPIEGIRTTHPFQVSVRFLEGVQAESLWLVIADAMRQDGLDLSRIVRSKHSVDILANGVNKSLLVAHLIQKFKIDPYQVLTMGDEGAWPGNDASLLEHRFSLSVAFPSRRLDRGWKLAPAHKRYVDATLWYLERIKIQENGCFHVELPK